MVVVWYYILEGGDMTGLAQRRHDRFRMRKRAGDVMKDWGTSKKFVPYMADNMQLCSCYMCGNPRKHFGELTVQERRAVI